MNNQRLIIRVCRASFIFSTSSLGEVAFERYPLKASISLAANMREALRTIPMLQERYSYVIAMLDSPILLMSTDQFQADAQERAYRFTFTGQEQHFISHYIVPDLNAVAVFSIHKDLRTVLVDQYGESLRLQPIMVNIWNHLYQKSFTGPRHKLYGYFHDGQLDIFAFAQNRFKFNNSYAVSSNPNDSLYYLLSVWKQLAMEAGEDELHLCGNLPEREQLTEEARRFIKRVFVTNPSGEFNRAPVTQIQDMPYDLMVYYLKRK